MAGWEVHPKVFGDGKTYFFTRWADKSKNKGCTNLLCPGFVQVEPSFHLGKPVADTSTYNGKQFEMMVDISHDPETNNWWVRLNNRNLGYYPGILFSNLAFANLGGWTGMTSTPAGIPSPPMGSGHFPDNNLYRSCFIRQMNFQTDTRKHLGPINYEYAVASSDSPNCFGVQYEGWNDDIQGYAMIFGGPGGNCVQEASFTLPERRSVPAGPSAPTEARGRLENFEERQNAYIDSHYQSLRNYVQTTADSQTRRLCDEFNMLSTFIKDGSSSTIPNN
ncbi:PREDICTED: uncharacterized protein LOC109352867 [Lupinus angustifolius]|uniref:uncharacterized protein LOC109352867 n=1 Tax=Lupinus angustifolius TaxID=3871 RepID=UPI00092EDC92|nr:PREDICTED: uncharacterized protein LOC109352867 [Lupinus angustifolius]